jgi:hypothetical protein
MRRRDSAGRLMLAGSLRMGTREVIAVRMPASLDSSGDIGADSQNRTVDPIITNDVLYQLS